VRPANLDKTLEAKRVGPKSIVSHNSVDFDAVSELQESISLGFRSINAPAAAIFSDPSDHLRVLFPQTMIQGRVLDPFGIGIPKYRLSAAAMLRIEPAPPSRLLESESLRGRKWYFQWICS
jgi:hypothetical protein